MAAASPEPVKTFSIGFEARSTTSCPRAQGHRRALRHRPPRVRRRARRARADPAAREALRRALRRLLGDPQLLPGRAHPAAGDGGAQRRRRRRELRRLPAPRRQQHHRPDGAPAGVAGRAAAGWAGGSPGSPATSASSPARSGCSCRWTSPRSSATRTTSPSSTRRSAPSCWRPSFAREVDPGRARDVIAAALGGGSGLRPPRQAAGGRRPDVPARGPPGEDGHRDDGALAGGALAASRPHRDGVRRLAAAPPQGAPDEQEVASARQAYRGRVPDSILDGAKKGFALPLGPWFRDELRDYAREVLLDPRALDRGYTRRDAVERITRHACAGGGGPLTPDLGPAHARALAPGVHRRARAHRRRTRVAPRRDDA